MPHLVATLIYLSQIYSYYIKGDRSPLTSDNHGPTLDNVSCETQKTQDVEPMLDYC